MTAVADQVGVAVENARLFAEVQQRSDYLLYAQNSLFTSVASTLLGLAIAVLSVIVGLLVSVGATFSIVCRSSRRPASCRARNR